MAVSQ
jgi:two-component system sensor histidine kinase KdpD